MTEVPRNHQQFLQLVRDRIAQGRDTYVCHAITSVAELALAEIRWAEEAGEGSKLPSTYGVLTQAMELYHAVQRAINYAPDGTGRVIRTFEIAYDEKHPDAALFLTYKEQRLEWLDRSICGGDDRGTVRNIINSRYPSYYATDEQLVKWQLENCR
jgi:hypothetical protein